MKGNNDWLVGAQIFKENGSLRYFEDQTRDSKSIGHARDYYDGIDVHNSSGVYKTAPSTCWPTAAATTAVLTRAVTTKATGSPIPRQVPGTSSSPALLHSVT